MAVNIEEVKQVQADQNLVIANQKVTVLKAVDELKSIGGEEDYEVGLRSILEAYPQGILLSKATTVLTDLEKLTKAREAMKIEIEETKKGKAVILKLKVSKAAE